MYPNYFPVGYQPAIYPQQIQPQAVQQAIPQQPAVPAAPIGDSGLTYVNGIEEVASWVVQRGQSAHLFDRNQNTFYVKSVSENGMPNPIEIYDYQRRETQQAEMAQKTASVSLNPDDYVRREEWNDLRAQVKALQKKKKEEAEDE